MNTHTIIKVARIATKLVASYGVGMLFEAVTRPSIQNLNLKLAPKIALKVGSLVLAAKIGQVAVNHVDALIDEALISILDYDFVDLQATQDRIL